MLPHLQHVMHKKGVLSICLHQKANLNLNWPLNWKKTGLYILSHGLMLMLSVFVSQEIHLASLGGDGQVKDNVYRMMFAVMTDEVGRTFNWSGKHGWRGEADKKRQKFQGTNLCRVVTRKCMMLIYLKKMHFNNLVLLLFSSH